MNVRSTTSAQGFKWPVAASLSIAAPADEVWTAISRPGHLELCHPFCEKNPVTVWSGAESRDEVHYLSGWVYERRFVRWIEGVGYDLEIGGHGEATSFVTWRLVVADQAESQLTITVYPHVLQNLPVGLRWFPHVLCVRPLLRRYLSSVLQGVEWTVTRAEPVPRNQFGKHPWFS